MERQKSLVMKLNRSPYPRLIPPRFVKDDNSSSQQPPVHQQPRARERQLQGDGRLLPAASPPQEKAEQAERSGKLGFVGGSPRLSRGGE